MRQFYLENSKGERISFMDKNHFLTSPTGLGFAVETTTIDTSKGFFSLADSKPSKGNIEGTIAFTDRANAYRDFRNLSKWMTNETLLNLVYIPYGTEEYYADVVLIRLNKEEKQNYGWLECETIFEVLTPWYSKQNISFDFEDGDANALHFPNKFPARFGLSSPPTALRLNLDCDYNAFVKVTIAGLQNNPKITLVDNDTNKLLGSVEFDNLVVPQGSKLVYDTRPNEVGVWLINGDEKENVLDKVHLTSENNSFFAIPTHTDVILNLELDNGVQTGTNATLYQYWKTR